MRELVDAYLARLRERHTAATARAASMVLARFRKDAESSGLADWADVDPEFVEGWLCVRRDRGASLSTLSTYAARLRLFFRWLWKEGLILVNPVDEDLFTGHVSRPVIVVPPEAAVAAAIDREEVAQVNVQRNRALMELMYSTGLRRGEVMRMNLRDVLGDEIRVLGKGRKERMVPLGDTALELLREYVAGERTMLAQRHGNDEEALFLSRRGGGRLDAQGISKALCGAMRSPVSPHMLRRACATHMLRAGAPATVLQKLLGHEQLSTTKIYTKVTEEDLRRECLRHHPGW